VQCGQPERAHPQRSAPQSLWTYVRDERPWSGDDPPAAWYQFSADRKGAHALQLLGRFDLCAGALSPASEPDRERIGGANSFDDFLGGIAFRDGLKRPDQNPGELPLTEHCWMFIGR
jgi:hypothetical protein